MARNRSLLLFVLLVSLVIDFSTDTPYRPGSWLGPFYGIGPANRLTSAACAAVLCLLALLPLLGIRRPAQGSKPRALTSMAIRLLPVASMVFAFFWSRPHVPPSLATYWNVLVVAGPLVVAACAVRRSPPLHLAAAVALVGIAVRMVHFARFSIDVGGDMLPLTQSALDSFVRLQSPYGYHRVPDLLPLTYYPLTWLAYLPAYVAHIDLRWTNTFAELAIPAAVVYAGRRPGSEPSSAAGSAGTALLLWSFVFLLPSSVYFDRITTAPVAWALLAWTLAVTARGSRFDWLFAGLLAAATPLAALLLPFCFVSWWRRFSSRQALLRLGGAAAVALIFIAPFYVWSPRDFLDGAVLWFNDLTRFPGTKWKLAQTWERYVGFGGLFWKAGWQRALALIQWSLIAGLVVLYRFRGAAGRALPAFVAVAFVAFMVFNSVHWPYFYQPALFSALVGAAVLPSSPASEMPESRLAGDGTRKLPAT